MKSIHSFNINTEDMSAVSQSRNFRIQGDEGAVFSLRVTTAAGKSYNFKTKVFDTIETPNCRISNQELDEGLFSSNILFPADANGEVYTVILTTDPHFETILSDSLLGVKADGTQFAYNPTMLQFVITQVADVTVTFALAGTEANYTEATFDDATVTAVQSPTVSSAFERKIDWSVKNAATDAKGFGLIINPDGLDRAMKTEAANPLQSSAPVSNGAWYADVTAVINDTKSDDGGGSTHFNYNVLDVSGLRVGMPIQSISSGTLGGAVSLTKVAIGSTGKGFKMTSGKAFADGITLTLRGYGLEVINNSLGLKMTINNMIIKQLPTTTAVRSAVSNATAITVVGTYGISAGAFIEGFGVDNSVSNPITDVSTPSSGAGTIAVTTNQTLTAGTALNILGSSDSFSIQGDITIESFPSRDVTLYLDLDKLLTLGTAS